MSIRKYAVLVTVMALTALSPALLAQDPKEAEGKALFNERCHACHELSTITVKSSTSEEWNEVVTRMISYGAQVTEPEKEKIVTYLAKTYGPDRTAAAPSDGSVEQHN